MVRWLRSQAPSAGGENYTIRYSLLWLCCNSLGADQGLLNSFFSNWSTADIQKHLPFIYNLSSNTTYTYSPAFKQ